MGIGKGFVDQCGLEGSDLGVDVVTLDAESRLQGTRLEGGKGAGYCRKARRVILIDGTRLV